MGRLAGFKTFDDYTEESTLLNSFPGIKIPTFLLVSKDDPICGYDGHLFGKVTENPNILIGTTSMGSHVVYYEGLLEPNQWFPKPTF